MFTKLGVPLAGILLAAIGPTALADNIVRQEWRFNEQTRWAGWQPGGAIHNTRFSSDTVSFRAEGPDPLITGPEFKLSASNLQWVEIDLDSDTPGDGQLFYTNKSTGRYGGFEPHWMVSLDVPRTGRQTVITWPFWEGLKEITRLRFDPPSEARCTLHAIRIVEAAPHTGAPEWDFKRSEHSWRPMHAAELDQTSGVLRVKALQPQALIFTPVAPFTAERQSLLRIDATCPGEHVLSLYWMTKEHPGLFGQPVELRDGRAGSLWQKGTGSELNAADTFKNAVPRGACPLLPRPVSPDRELDLRQFPQWQGTVTGLALGFGTFGRETLTLRSLAISANDPKKPLLRAKLHFSEPIARAGTPAMLKVTVEHAAGPVFAGGQALLETQPVRGRTQPAGAPPFQPVSQHAPVPPIEPGTTAGLEFKMTPLQPGDWPVRLYVNNQELSSVLHVEPPYKPITLAPSDYEVPLPRPVETDYNLGIYYFPGWSPEQLGRWQKQVGFPERDPVLGWYAEGRPEVADWHIKWAVENGLSFFIYDWYWRNGKEELGAGLNEGFLKARYCGLVKFAIMWANHAPFAGHSREQLLAVTDYWLEHFFRRPNYLTIDGKPYVSFFLGSQVVSDLGGPENCKEVLKAMRQRVRAAGLPGLHIGGCNAPPQALKAAGFDSLTGYNYRRTGATTLQSPYRQYLLGHEALWEGFRKGGITYLPLLTVGWDSRPWAGPRAEARFARRTQDLEEALRRLKSYLDAHQQRTGILEAWNEWGEGSYIEPNAEFGFGDLEAIRRVFAKPGNWPTNISPADVGLARKYDLRATGAK